MIARACKLWFILAALAGALTCAHPAAAHAPPEANGIQWLGQRALVRSNRGLILQAESARTFGIVCNDAFRASLVEVPPLATTVDGRILVGTFEAGLLLSSADSCSFFPVLGALSGVNAVAVAASAELVRAIVLPLDGSPAALYESRDDGRNFEAITTFADTPTALEVAPGDAQRLYVSVLAATDNQVFARLLRSNDGGQTFSELPIELDASELRAFIVAVDPLEPDRIFVRTQSRDGITPERLLRSDDGGQSFEVVLRAPGPLSVTMAGDGTVWAGSAVRLYRSNDGARSFTALSTLDLSHVSCLAAHAGGLYVCGFHAGEFGVLNSADQGQSLAWFLRFPDVRARLDCAAQSDEGERCESSFRDWSLEQGLTEATGGVVNGGAAGFGARPSGGAGAGGGSGSSSGGGAVQAPGCALAGPPRRGDSAAILFWLLLLVALARSGERLARVQRRVYALARAP